MKKFQFLWMLLCLMSCGQKEKTSLSTFENERRVFFNNLVVPAELAARLQATGAEFNPSLLNNPVNFSAYNDDVKAAANMGIYLSDLNYCVAYKQLDHVKAIFPAAHSLSKVMGIEKSTLDFILQRYHDNLTQNDSAAAMVGTLYLKATRDREGAAREDLVGIAMSAYQIENLHLALGIIESYPKDLVADEVKMQMLVPVFKMVLDQQHNVEIIYHFLKSTADITRPDRNPNYPYYANAFEELIGVYKKLNVSEKIANNQAAELMNDEVIRELRGKVDAIRNRIVTPGN